MRRGGCSSFPPAPRFLLPLLLLVLPVVVCGSRSLCLHGTIGCLLDNPVYDFGSKLGENVHGSHRHSQEFARRKTTQNAPTTSPADVSEERKKDAKKIDWAIVSTLVLFSTTYGLYIYLEWRSLPGVSPDDDAATANIPDVLSVKRFRYSEVKNMTGSFSSVIGRGGYGVVYKGALGDGTAVAVKMLRETKGTIEEFISEVASISRTNHVNIVGLLGFCSEGPKKALVYEYMTGGSLDKVIFAGASAAITWEQKHRIAVGIAKGLEYLHKGCNTRMVHFDIKPHNILLDEGLGPKISDFGLAKLYKDEGSYLSSVLLRGTIGYIAPEVISRNFGMPSSKSDVYSYGMVVLEMVAGRRNMSLEAPNASDSYFPHWIHENLDEERVLEACGVTPGSELVARKMILVGLWCIQTDPASRPSIDGVLEMLEGPVESLEVPPKPYICSPEPSRTNAGAIFSPSSAASDDRSDSQLLIGTPTRSI